MKRILALAAVVAVSLIPSAFGQTQGEPFTEFSSTAMEKSHVVVAAAAQLKMIYAVNTDTVTNYLMVFDSTTVPSNGAVSPVHCLPIQAGNFVDINNDFGGTEKFSTGISVALSSTNCGTLTLVATNVAWFRVRYQ